MKEEDRLPFLLFDRVAMYVSDLFFPFFDFVNAFQRHLPNIIIWTWVKLKKYKWIIYGHESGSCSAFFIYYNLIPNILSCFFPPQISPSPIHYSYHISFLSVLGFSSTFITAPFFSSSTYPFSTLDSYE